MKPKKKRKEISKIRQRMAKQLAGWTQKILEFEVELRAGDPGAAGRIAFCRAEQAKCRKALQRLNTRQRSWVTHGFLGE